MACVRRRLSILALLGALPATAGCSDRGTAVASPRSAELSVGYAETSPRASRDRGIDRIITALTSERLLHLGRDGRPEPALAYQWSQSEDGKAWRFTLRQGLTLQDGSPLTSATVVSTLRQVLGSRSPSVPPSFRDVVAIDEAGPTELVIRLTRPNAFLLEDLIIFPVQGGRDGAQRAGPFRLLAKSEGEATLEAFPDYHRGRPKLGQIRIREFESPRIAWSSMLRGEIDFLYDVGPDALDFVEQSPTTFVATFLRPYAMAMVFNLAHPTLRRPGVRAALNAGVDRAEIIRSALNGRGVPATDHVWPRHWAYDPQVAGFTHDAARARALLDAEGLPARPAGDGKPGARFAFTCLVPDDPRIERVALLVQRQLAGIGVHVQLESLPLPEFQQRVLTSPPDAFMNELVSGHGMNFNYVMWHSASGGAPFFKTRYRGADAALERYREARNDGETRAAVSGVQRALRSDPPGIFLYWPETTRAISRRFVVPRDQDRDILSTVAQWSAAAPASQ
jgi:peptide/nickel transport system substrate-binding protein